MLCRGVCWRRGCLVCTRAGKGRNPERYARRTRAVKTRVVAKTTFDEFMRHFRWMLTAREEFNRHKTQPPECLTDIQRAVRFTTFNAHHLAEKSQGKRSAQQTTSPKRINLLRLEEDLSAAHLRLHNVVVEQLRGGNASNATMPSTPCFT